jgi:predicted dithiol-disulfide oxidoreductase (DUF899 family)
VEETVMSHDVVSDEEWLSARKKLLAREKQLTRLRDEVATERRALPWQRVTKPYAFEGPAGRETLAELFGAQSQLAVYHFMFDPEWDAGCKSCSFWADNFDGIDVHLRHRDVAFVAVSRAPWAKLEAYRRRMGWRFKWLSSADGDFNYDYFVSFRDDELANGTAFWNYARRSPPLREMVGISVFAKQDGQLFHTYSCYERGVEMVNGAYSFIDLTPKGRDEGGRSQFWVRRHDEYED